MILFILKIKPSNIYEIKKFIDKNLAPFMQVSSGAILPALKRLEASNMIVSEKEISQGGFRKTVFKILPQGEEKFVDFLKEPIIAAPQILRRETEILTALWGHEIFSEEETFFLKEKIINALQDNIMLLKKTIALNMLNVVYFEEELAYCQKKLERFLPK